jgi:hypothetical protein
MDIDSLCDTLAHQGEVFRHLSTGISDDQARVHLQPGAWSLLEVYCHLYDEEREDFRIRVIQTLTAPELPLPDIDPQGWVQTRRYNEQSLAQVCQHVVSERQRSVAQLRALAAVNWQQPLNHPRLRQLTAAQVAWAWVAHDLLHIRQITELRYRHFAQHTDAYGYGYAGEWGPD